VISSSVAFRNAGIREDDIEPVILAVDQREEAIQIAKIRHVSLYAGHICSDLRVAIGDRAAFDVDDVLRQANLPRHRDGDGS
jgi:hypothetical protein